MNAEEHSLVQARVRAASRDLHATIRGCFARDLLLLGAWIGAFVAFVPRGHAAGAALVSTLPVALGVARLAALRRLLFLPAAQVYRVLRADKMFNAPTRFRTLAFISHVPPLYTYTVLGYASALVAHPVAAVVLVVYAGVRAHADAVAAVLLVYALVTALSAVCTYRVTARLYDVGVQASTEEHLGGEELRTVYARVLSAKKVARGNADASAQLAREAAAAAKKKPSERGT